MKLIVEIKAQCPFLGDLHKEIDAARMAAEFEESGASIISVSTIKDCFMNLPADARKGTKLPIMWRDDDVRFQDDVKFARDSGVDLLVLIARNFESVEKLDEMCFYTSQAGMKPVVEVFLNEDVRKANLSDTGRLLVNRVHPTTGKISPACLEYYGRRLNTPALSKYEVYAAGRIVHSDEIKQIGQWPYDGVILEEAFIQK